MVDGPDARGRQAGYKPRAVEEPVDYWLHRPLASALVPWLMRLGVEARTVTVASGVIGLMAGIVIGVAPPASIAAPWLAAALLLLSIVLDCADGQIARLRGQASILGEALDGTFDTVTVVSVFLGFAAYLTRCGMGDLHMWAIGWAAGFSFRWQVHSYDVAKNIHLQVLGEHLGSKSSRFPADEQVEKQEQECRRRRDRLGLLAMRMYRGYLADQRAMQSRRVAAGGRQPADDRERELYARTFERSMRLWVWNGLGMHLHLFFIALLLTPWVPVSAIALFWFLAVPMNLYTLALKVRDRRLERAFAKAGRG